MKKVVYFIILSILVIVVYLNLPISIRYYSDIKLVNEYITNIKSYQDSTGKLPESYDWVILVPLMPIEMENEWSPEYVKLDSINFELVYPYGFDGPYLRYCSYIKIWSFGFNCFD